MLETNRDKMELALSATDVKRIVASGKLALILGIEAGFDQDGDIDILRLWHRLGVRLIQFSSHVTTAYADSSVGGEPKWSGINDRGRRLIAEMNRLGVIIDITHATEAAQRQIIEASKAPVVASHDGSTGGLQQFTQSVRRRFARARREGWSGRDSSDCGRHQSTVL